MFAVVRSRDWPEDPGAVAPGAPFTRLVRAGEVAAVVGDDADCAGAPSSAPLLLHETVVEALGARAATAPVVPGCVAADEAALRRWLADSAPDLAHLLHRIDGRCEVEVLAWWDRGAAAAAAAADESHGARVAGAAADAFSDAVDEVRRQRARLHAQLERDPDRPTYLLRHGLRTRESALAAAYGERLAAALHRRFAALAESARRGGAPSADLLLDAAYLVPRDRLGALDRLAAELTAAHRGAVTLRRTAARVPWRFATLRPFTSVHVRRAARAIAAAGGVP